LIKPKTNYYLKTPPVTKPSTEIGIKISTTIKTESAVSITFYMKFYGLNPNTTLACPKVFSLNVDTKFCYDFALKTFFFYYQGNIVYKEMSFYNYIGHWAFVSISNYNSDIKKVADFFPNMFNLFIESNDAPRFAGDYFVPSPGMAIDSFVIGSDIMALFADIRFYRNFIINGRGLVQSTFAPQDLIAKYTFSSSSSTNPCVFDHELDTETFLSLGLECIADFNPYLDSTVLCGDDTKALNYNSPTNTTCTGNDVIFMFSLQS